MFIFPYWVIKKNKKLWSKNIMVFMSMLLDELEYNGYMLPNYCSICEWFTNTILTVNHKEYIVYDYELKGGMVYFHCYNHKRILPIRLWYL